MRSTHFAVAVSLVLLAPVAPAQEAPATSQGAEAQTMPLTPAEQAAIKAKRHKQKYDEALRQLMPLSPAQIEALVDEVDNRRKAAKSAPIPDARTVSMRMTLAPGEAPQTIQLAPHYASALTLLDATGQPWPVTSQTVGDASQFTVLRPVENGAEASILTVAPLTPYARTNLIITLADLAVPIVLRLTTTPKVNYDRVGLIVSRRGPYAVAPVAVRDLPDADNEVMRYLLDDIPVGTAKPVEIEGGPARGYLVGDRFYLRTALDLVFPAWVSSLSGAGDVTVYEIPITPVITATDRDGATVDMTLPSWLLVDTALAQNGTTLGAIHYGPPPAGADNKDSAQGGDDGR